MSKIILDNKILDRLDMNVHEKYVDKNEFKNCLDGLFESLCDVSDWMYENPELGFQEFKTSKYLVDYIQKNSKSVNYPSHGLETAFDITFGEEGPLTVICVEYDALPEIGHFGGCVLLAHNQNQG